MVMALVIMVYSLPLIYNIACINDRCEESSSQRCSGIHQHLLATDHRFRLPEFW